MVLLCCKLFLRGDEVVSIRFDHFIGDLAIVDSNGVVEALAIKVRGKCDPRPVTLMIWSDDVIPQLCRVRHTLIYVRLACGPTDEFLFSGEKNGHFSPGAFQDRFKAICNKLLDRDGPFGTHSCRKTAYLLAVWGGGEESDMMLSARHRSVSQAVKYKRDALFTLNVAKKNDRNLTQVVPTWKSIVCLDLQMGRAINTKGSLAYKPLNDLAEYFVDHLCGCHGQTNVLRVVQSVMNFNKPTTTYDSIREFCSSNLSADNSRQLIQLIDTFAMELRCKLAQNDSDVGVLNTTPNDEKMDGYIDTKQTPGSSKRKRGGTFDFEGRHSLRKVPDPIAKLKQIINYHEQIPQDYSQMTEPARVFALTTLIPVVLCLKHHCQGDEATFLTR
ncbi:hypothetical protein LEN26_016708, partial [Aphanomyces euteiches]